jgi:hypothetical protein
MAKLQHTLGFNGKHSSLRVSSLVRNQPPEVLLSNIPRFRYFLEAVAERCIMPLNQDELCGYRRPNCHFRLEHQEPPSDLVSQIDKVITGEFKECFAVCDGFLAYHLQVNFETEKAVYRGF